MASSLPMETLAVSEQTNGQNKDDKNIPKPKYNDTGGYEDMETVGDGCEDIEDVEVTEDINLDVTEPRRDPTTSALVISNSSKWRAMFAKWIPSGCKEDGGGTSYRAPIRFSTERSSSWEFVVKSVILWVLICIPGNIFAGVLMFYTHHHDNDNDDMNSNGNQSQAWLTVDNQSASNFVDNNIGGAFKAENNSAEGKNYYPNETVGVSSFPC